MNPPSTANVGTSAMMVVANGNETPREPELVIRKTRIRSRRPGWSRSSRSFVGTLASRIADIVRAKKHTVRLDRAQVVFREAVRIQERAADGAQQQLVLRKEDGLLALGEVPKHGEDRLNGAAQDALALLLQDRPAGGDALHVGRALATHPCQVGLVVHAEPRGREPVGHDVEGRQHLTAKPNSPRLDAEGERPLRRTDEHLRGCLAFLQVGLEDGGVRERGVGKHEDHPEGRCAVVERIDELASEPARQRVYKRSPSAVTGDFINHNQDCRGVLREQRPFFLRSVVGCARREQTQEALYRVAGAVVRIGLQQVAEPLDGSGDYDAVQIGPLLQHRAGGSSEGCQHALQALAVEAVSVLVHSGLLHRAAGVVGLDFRPLASTPLLSAPR